MEATDDRYREIIEQSYNCFTQNGLKSVSMDDIAKYMAISKKTLYKYVSSKNDLLNKITDYIHQRIRNRIDELHSGELNAIDVLLEMSKVSNATHTNIKPVINFEIRKYYPAIYDRYIQSKKKLIVDSIIDNLNKGIKEGLFRQDLNTEIVAHLYFKKMEELFNVEQDDLRNFSYAKIFEVMFENHIRGISNEKGIAYFEKQKAKLNFNI